MAQDFARKFYRSTQWIKCREAYLMTPITTPFGVVPPGICERCFSLGEVTPATLVHHKAHLSPANIDNPNITLCFDNLQRLCRDCHAYVHGGSDSAVVFVNGEAKPARDESLRSVVMRLTETVDERRNIHKEGRHG